MRKIVYTRPDGGISVVNPVTSEQDAWNKLPANALNPRFVAASEVPIDRTFRNAWKADLTVDMPKAREIHRDALRQKRAPLLAALDTAYMLADETGNVAEKARIAAKKQALRGVTADPAIDSASTPEELKEAIPVALK
jgi:hypothetical protein